MMDEEYMLSNEYNEHLKAEIAAEFEKWYTKALSIFPDVGPYKDILFLAFVAGAIYSSDLSRRELQALFDKFS